MSTIELQTPLKTRILMEALPLVPQLGWSMEALKQGCLGIGLESWHADRVFESSQDAIQWWHHLCTLHMEETCALDGLKIREKIEALVMNRILYFAPHKEAFKMSLKYIGCRQFKMLAVSVNAMWYMAGDISTDYNYYSKRLLLGGVYSSALAFWVSGKDIEQTRYFLRARIENVLSIGTLKARMGGMVKGLFKI